MLRIAIAALSAVLSQCGQAQNEFSRRYDSFEQLQVQEGWAVELRGDSGYAVVHMTEVLSDGSDYLVASLLLLDPQGNVDTVTRVPLNSLVPGIYCGWTNSSQRMLNGSYLVGGSTSATDGTHEAALIKFDSAGFFDTMYTYLPEGTEFIGRQAKQTPDGGFVLTGSRSLNGNTDGFLLKTDANGVQEWVQTYGGAGYEGFMSVDNCLPGGFYLGGISLVSGSGSGAQLVVRRVDDLGTEVWDRNWGGPFNEANAHLSSCSDGHALIASKWATSNQSGRLYMAKLNSSDGGTLWDQTYGLASVNTTLFAAKEVEPFGDLIATGQALENNGEVGVLLRTTSAGDSLWMRYYKYHDAVVDSGDGQLRDVLPTPDGGFIAVGVAFGIGPYSQDVWVIKTDSMGCIEPGCNLIQGMQTQITNLHGVLTVAPNPVASGGSVQVSIQLPVSFVPQGALHITVTDAAGRMVHEENLTPHTSAPTLHTSFVPGLYHLHLHDNTRWISGAKLLVE